MMFVFLRMWRLVRHRRQLRDMRQRLAVLKAENDRVFWHAVNSAPQHLRGKAAIRWGLDVLEVGDEYHEEKDLRRRIFVLEGRWVPLGDGVAHRVRGLR